MSREQALKAANLIADDFTTGFCDHRMVELFADRIEEVYKNENVMSLRDLFAAKAMQAEIAEYSGIPTTKSEYLFEIAVNAYLMADAMLKIRGMEIRGIE
jgi:hypothetical protein